MGSKNLSFSLQQNGWRQMPSGVEIWGHGMQDDEQHNQCDSKIECEQCYGGPEDSEHLWCYQGI